jgi:hypothetical protein
MQKGFRIGAVAGALSIAMSGSAFAATDLSFGGWSVSGGNISTSGATVCASTSAYNCSIVASGSGFAQVQLTPKSTSGTPYIMTIITDQNANSTGIGDPGLGFYDVNFVQSSNGGTTTTQNGILGQQSISSVGNTGFSPETSFKSTTNLATGWAQTQTGANPITITQNIVDNANTSSTADDFSTGFYFTQAADASGNPTGFEMTIDQSSGLNTPGQPDTGSGIANVQAFAYRERAGSMLSGGSVDLGSDSNGNPRSLTWTGGGNLATGNDVKAIWLGQSVDVSNTDASGTVIPGGALASTFGYLSFDNVADSATAPISASSLGGTISGPAVWNTDGTPGTTSEFNINGNTKPCLADPTGASCP